MIPSVALSLGGVDGVDVDVWKEANMNSVRSSSFFSESAYFAQFMLPLLALEVFYVSNRKSYFRAIIMVIVLVALQSGNALFGLVVFILCFIKYVYSKMNIIVFVCFIFSISLVGLIASPLLLKTEQGEKLMLRQEQLESDQNKNSSGFLRIWRGYFVYASLNAKEQLFGLNNKEILKRRIASSPVFFTFKSENDLYFNAIHSILLQTGMIGLILFFIFIIFSYPNAAYPPDRCRFRRPTRLHTCGPHPKSIPPPTQEINRKAAHPEAILKTAADRARRR